jgi:hypothetical protein
MIRTAGREEHPRKLLIPRCLAAASNIHRLKGLPPKRAAISVSAVSCWKKLDPPASNAAVPRSGTDDSTRDSRARRSNANAESPTAQRTAETAHSASAAPRVGAASIPRAPGPLHKAATAQRRAIAEGLQHMRRIPSIELRRAALKHRKSNVKEIASCRRLAHRRSTRAPT